MTYLTETFSHITRVLVIQADSGGISRSMCSSSQGSECNGAECVLVWELTDGIDGERIQFH